MGFVIELARRNVAHGSGGPFGAAVFERETGRLIAPGANLVASTACSLAHAEMVALTIAQQLLGTFDLGEAGIPACELVTSVEPCAMCLGAIPWAGVRHLVCGARGTDAEAIGFDEGAKPAAWHKGLESRGITVTRDVCRPEARAVLRDYLAGGGLIYNARQVKN
jgi:tRNA(Arg) A34 adenosine deaminase TadA